MKYLIPLMGIAVTAACLFALNCVAIVALVVLL